MDRYKQKKLATAIKKNISDFDSAYGSRTKLTTRDILIKIVTVVSGGLFLINTVLYYGQLINTDNYSYKRISTVSKGISSVSGNKASVEVKADDEFFYRTKAEEALKSQNDNKALEYYKKAININDKNVTVLTNTVNLLIKKKSYEEALIYLDKIVEAEPKSISAYNVKGSCLYLLNRYEEASEAFIKVIEADEADANTYKLLGDIAINQTKYAKAIEYYKMALSIADGDVAVYQNMGLSEARLGNFKEAVEYYDKALKIDPENTTVINNKQELLKVIQK